MKGFGLGYGDHYRHPGRLAKAHFDALLSFLTSVSTEQANSTLSFDIWTLKLCEGIDHEFRVAS